MKKISLTKKTLIAIMCFLLILPDEAFGWIALYRSSTPINIDYIWLDYSFGIVQLAILAIGLFYVVTLKKILFILFFAFAFTRETVFFFVTGDNVFSDSCYEIYLALIVGYSFVLWAEGGLNDKDACNIFFKFFLLTNVLTLYVNMYLGGNEELVGRYHASNLDVGWTGVLCSITFIYIFYSKEKKILDYLFIILSVFGLFLSGSRANTLLLCVIVTLSLGESILLGIKKTEMTSEKKESRALKYAALFFITVFILVIQRDMLLSMWDNERFQNLISSEAFADDNSYLGRMNSLEVGLSILKRYPLGISGYFVNLQQEARLRGYPTFPHFTILSMYLLIGPLFLLVYVWWIRLLKSLHKVDTRYFTIILFIFVNSIVYGGPIVNFKIIFLIMMPTVLAQWEVNDKKNEIAEDNNVASPNDIKASLPDNAL